MKVINVFFALVRNAVFGLDLGETKNLITPEILPSLYNLSKKHDLAHLVCDSLDKNGVLVGEETIVKRFIKSRNTAYYRHELLEYELEQICAVLEKSKIPFMPLKGSLIRKYYNESWMRTSCDIDVLVKEQDVPSAIEILCAELSYKKGNNGSHDVNLTSPSGISLELHFSLTEDQKWQDLFCAVWDKTLDGKAYHYAMSNEMIYVYHIVHMAVHMRTGGCGVKPFIDLLMLLEKMPFNKEITNDLLVKADLKEFEIASIKLAMAWLKTGELNETDKLFEEYVLTGGVYGTIQNRVLVEQTKKGGKFRYILSRIFVNYKDLSIKYPSLKKCKILFPFYQIYRWFDLAFNKKSRTYTKSTIKNTKTTTKEQIDKTRELFNKIGL